MRDKFVPELICEELRDIAETYEKTSPKYLSLELSSKALLFIHATGQGNQFALYLKEISENLGEAEVNFLSAIGLPTR